jgi:hypothetical protein
MRICAQAFPGSDAKLKDRMLSLLLKLDVPKLSIADDFVLYTG